ncbi:hypothetical protein Tco_1244337 [Tanacetum coccineum]
MMIRLENEMIEQITIRKKFKDNEEKEFIRIKGIIDLKENYSLVLTIPSQMTYPVTILTLNSARSYVMQGASCTQRKNSKVLFRRPFVIVIVRVVAVVTVIAIIRIVVVVDGVSSTFKLSFTIIGFLYRIMLEYLMH